MNWKSGLITTLVVSAAVVHGQAAFGSGQDDARHRGRKYKAPPATSVIEVKVLKQTTGKPVANAAVIFHAKKDGRDEGNLEVKTNDEGKASIDIIATGSSVDVQVIADGLATYAASFQVDEPKREITISLVKPRAQVSAYVDNAGKAAERPFGVQEPPQKTSAPVIQAPRPTGHTSDPGKLAPGTQNDGKQQNQDPNRPSPPVEGQPGMPR